MKKKTLIAFFIGIAASLFVLPGCAAKALEKELNVVFMNEGEMVDSGVVTQFKNIQSPTIPEAYVPENYRFLGWTGYSMDELDLNSPTNFKSQYIAGGRMVHYMDVEKFAVNQTVVLEALIMHKDDIPKEYHYAVVAWYDKAANSGLDQAMMDKYEGMLKTYLTNQGVSEEDVNSVVVRGYAGNVGPTTGQILYDDDVDIMFGWGSLSNITTTGSIPEEMVRESLDYQIGTHARFIHRISDNPGGIKVVEHLLSDEVKAYFAGQEVD